MMRVQLSRSAAPSAAARRPATQPARPQPAAAGGRPRRALAAAMGGDFESTKAEREAALEASRQARAENEAERKAAAQARKEAKAKVHFECAPARRASTPARRRKREGAPQPGGWVGWGGSAGASWAQASALWLSPDAAQPGNAFFSSSSVRLSLPAPARRERSDAPPSPRGREALQAPRWAHALQTWPRGPLLEGGVRGCGGSGGAGPERGAPFPPKEARVVSTPRQ